MHSPRGCWQHCSSSCLPPPHTLLCHSPRELHLTTRSAIQAGNSYNTLVLTLALLHLPALPSPPRRGGVPLPALVSPSPPPSPSCPRTRRQPSLAEELLSRPFPYWHAPITITGALLLMVRLGAEGAQEELRLVGYSGRKTARGQRPA